MDRRLVARSIDPICEYGLESPLNSRLEFILKTILTAVPLLAATAVQGHEVSQQDVELISDSSGLQVALFVWLGAKHMVTGYDHLLFLAGVIFLLIRVRDIVLYVSLFAIGHTITLISGVLFGLGVNPYLVDAVIGFSVAYKGFDNLGGFQRLFGDSPDDRLAVFLFGLFHGLGLATKLQDLGFNDDGLVANLIAFNVGVELGQFAALFGIIMLSRPPGWEQYSSKTRVIVNVGLIVAGFALMAYQLALYWNAG